MGSRVGARGPRRCGALPCACDGKRRRAGLPAKRPSRRTPQADDEVGRVRVAAGMTTRIRRTPTKLRTTAKPKLSPADAEKFQRAMAPLLAHVGALSRPFSVAVLQGVRRFVQRRDKELDNYRRKKVGPNTAMEAL